MHGHTTKVGLLGVSLAAAGCPAPTFTVEDPTTTTETTTAATTTTHGSADSTTGASGSDGCVADGAAGAPPDWWNADWTRRRLVTIDASIVPEGEMVDGFPVLVRVPAPQPGPACQTDAHGRDFRFRAVQNDVALDYDIDGWSPDGQLEIWLRVPVLTAGQPPLEVWLYDGNPEAGPGEDPAAVWGTYTSVHHLGIDLEDSAGTHHGSSQWEPGLCADPSNIDEPGACVPVIGCARAFDPDLLHDVQLEQQSDYNFGDGPGGSGGYQPELGVSLWMNSSEFVDGTPLVAKGETAWEIGGVNTEGVDRVAFLVECRMQAANCINPDDPDNCDCEPINDDLPAIASQAVVNDGTWHHVAVTANDGGPGMNLFIYVDGQLAGEADLVDYVGQNEQPLRFGHNIGMGTRYRGALDEIRVAHRLLTAAWIAAEYATVTQEHVTVGQEQVLCP